LHGLAQASAPHPAHGHKLRYANPANGGHPFTTMAAFMQWLPGNFHGAVYRSTDGTVFNVAEGACRVEFGGRVYPLSAHDVFVVPPWEPYRFEVDHDCLLFSFSDRAAQEALGFWREQMLNMG
jgi:gentisate 1,2-dioxygenase